MQKAQSIALVTTPTRYQGLLQRWGTRGQARFRLKQAIAHQGLDANQPDPGSSAEEADFDLYAAEHSNYEAVVDELRNRLAGIKLPVALVERRYLPSFEFRNAAVVLVVGPDGLVANTAKYVGELPIVGINPDPRRNDGVLLPFRVHEAARVVQQVLAGQARLKPVSMAAATLNDGQQLLAFNDLFIGRRTHVSARYNLTVREGNSEPQSSSGVIVATGAGSTGWLSSVFNMMQGVTAWSGGQPGKPLKIDWQDRKLAWVVREPFASRHSRARLVAGMIAEGESLVLESLMPEGGAVFSDGIEDDFLEFNSGTTVRITLASRQARLAVR